MAEVTASMVSDLRAKTGLGMMECKKALVEADGDAARAEDILRIKSGGKASRLAGRSAKEGLLVSSVKEAVGALVEINCETDFVAQDTHFVHFADLVAEAVQTNNPIDLVALADVKTKDGATVEELRKAIVAKMGENISVRRFVRFEAPETLASYLHGNKIGVMVDYEGGDEQLGHDIAMHIAACKPLCVDATQIDPVVLERERRIYNEQAAQSGKPADIVAKIVEGRVAKFLAEVTLLGQSFVKNTDLTIEQLLAEKKAKVNRFVLFSLGESIE